MSSAPGFRRGAVPAPGGASATLEVGRVARAHGVRGELKVALHWAESDALVAGRAVVLIGPGAERRETTVESVRGAPRALLVKLDGVDDKDAADALRGAALHVWRRDLPAPAPGEFYLSDLIGAKVVAGDREIGEVVEIRTHPSVDALAIRTPEGELLEQPLVDQWLESIDVEAGRIVLSSLDGLIE